MERWCEDEIVKEGSLDPLDCSHHIARNIYGSYFNSLALLSGLCKGSNCLYHCFGFSAAVSSIYVAVYAP